MSLIPVTLHVWLIRGLGANIYVIEGEKGIFLIDTGSSGTFFRISELIENELGVSLDDIQGIILTHWHLDHTGNVHDFLAETDAKIYIHRNDAKFVKIPDKRRILLNGNEVLRILGEDKIIHTPGHTPGHICILMKNILFSGDAIITKGSKPTLPKKEFCNDFKQTIISAISLSNYNFFILCPGHGSPILEHASDEVKLASKEWKQLLSNV